VSLVSSIFYTADFSGCGFLRSFLPCDYLNSVYGNTKQFMGIVSGRLFGDHNLLKSLQIIRFQRQTSSLQVTYIHQIAQLKRSGVIKAGLIYDLDDLFTDIPDYNYCKPYYNHAESINALNTIFDSVDIFTTSTEYLKKKMQEIRGNKIISCNFQVVPNLIPKFLYHRESIKEQTTKPRIVWAGSATHYSDSNLGDLGLIYDLIKNTQEEFDWHIIGTKVKQFEGMNVTQHPWVNNFYAYPKALRDINADFGISALLDNEFNRCKSNIKLLEYSAAQAITISSKVEPYLKESSLFLTGDWKTDRETIIEVYTNKQKKEELLNKQNSMLDNYWMETNMRHYVNLLGIR